MNTQTLAGDTKLRRPNMTSMPLLLLRFRAYLALIALIVLFSILSPVFLSVNNLIIVAQQVAVFAILGIGMTFVIICAGIDLSVGSITGLSAMIAGGLISQGLRVPFFDVAIFSNVVITCLIALGAGTMIGVINGLFITRLRVTDFIQTLGMLYVARGAAQLISDGATYGNLGGQASLGNTGFPMLGAGYFLGLPYSIWIMIVLAAVGSWVLRRTVFGMQVYALGGNSRAADLSGVRTSRVKICAYAISGFCAALAGLIIASRLGAANPSIGYTYELSAIAVVVLGGASLFGGVGTIGGTIIGAFVLGVLSNGMVLLGVSSFWQTVFTGAVIIFAVILDQFQRRVEKVAAVRANARQQAGSTSP